MAQPTIWLRKLFAASVVARYPDRFGMLANIPLDDPDANVALQEVDRASDELHTDGFLLVTNYGGRYLGHPSFEPVFTALNRLGTTVVVATHDAEFAAAFAARTVLLGDGRVVADAPTAEVLGGGWYFATQTARILGGAALDPATGAALLRERLDAATLAAAALPEATAR